MCEKMVVNFVARLRTSETIGGQDVGKFREEFGDTLRGGEESIAQREEDGGGKEVRCTEGEELLKTFWLASSRRRF